MKKINTGRFLKNPIFSNSRLLTDNFAGLILNAVVISEAKR